MTRRAGRTASRSATVGAWIASALSEHGSDLLRPPDGTAAHLEAPGTDLRAQPLAGTRLRRVEPAHLLSRPQQLRPCAERSGRRRPHAPAPRRLRAGAAEPLKVLPLEDGQAGEVGNGRDVRRSDARLTKALPVEWNKLGRGNETTEPVHLELLDPLGRPPLALPQRLGFRAGTGRVREPERTRDRLAHIRGHITARSCLRLRVCGCRDGHSSRLSPDSPVTSAPKSAQAVAPISVIRGGRPSSRGCAAPGNDERPSVVDMVARAAAAATAATDGAIPVRGDVRDRLGRRFAPDDDQVGEHRGRPDRRPRDQPSGSPPSRRRRRPGRTSPRDRRRSCRADSAASVSATSIPSRSRPRWLRRM